MVEAPAIETSQCETTRYKIEKLQDESKWNDLEVHLFYGIQFGTTGLRGKTDSGFALMNELLFKQHKLKQFIDKMMEVMTSKEKKQIENQKFEWLFNYIDGLLIEKKFDRVLNTLVGDLTAFSRDKRDQFSLTYAYNGVVVKTDLRKYGESCSYEIQQEQPKIQEKKSFTIGDIEKLNNQFFIKKDTAYALETMIQNTISIINRQNMSNTPSSSSSHPAASSSSYVGNSQQMTSHNAATSLSPYIGNSRQIAPQNAATSSSPYVGNSHQMTSYNAATSSSPYVGNSQQMTSYNAATSLSPYIGNSQQTPTNDPQFYLLLNYLKEPSSNFTNENGQSQPPSSG